jgi:exopolysaccharide biosynthesis polyprenyl glycosylphosphotransferase
VLVERSALRDRPTPGPQRRRPQPSDLLDGAAWVALRVTCDLIALIVGCLVALAIEPVQHGAMLLAIFPPLALALLHSRGRYRVCKRDLILDDVAPGIGAVSISAMAVVTLQLLTVTSGSDAVNSLIVWAWGLSLLGITFLGVALPLAQQAARRRRLVESPTLIVGTDVSALDIALRLNRHPEYGMRHVGFLDDDGGELSDDVPPVLGGLDDLERIVAEHGVKTIVIAYPDAGYQEMLAFVSRCDKLGMQTNVVPRFSSVVNHQTRFEYLGTVPLLNLRAINPESWPFSVKHAIDRVVAALLLAVLSPLFIALTLGVRLSSRGPILFRQPRTGRDGRVFDVLKFRTMTIDPPSGEQRFELVEGMAPGGVEGVDRRTRIGRLLRSTSLDELPQLINVVRGEMSLVGPRPERPEFAELFQRDIERYQDRHRVRAGITGWAQVHGLRGQTPLIDRVEFDNFYIEHWSLALDLKIMLLTIPALLRGS